MMKYEKKIIESQQKMDDFNEKFDHEKSNLEYLIAELQKNSEYNVPGLMVRYYKNQYEIDELDNPSLLINGELDVLLSIIKDYNTNQMTLMANHDDWTLKLELRVTG